jgi:hypothetical protein
VVKSLKALVDRGERLTFLQWRWQHMPTVLWH